MAIKPRTQSLAESHPELARQAVGWDPSEVSAGSSRKFNWRCLEGHIWQTSPKHRKNGTGCPVCAGQKIEVGVNDFTTTNPDLISQAYGWDPFQVTFPYSRKVSWQCQFGHVWEASISTRKRGTGCPSCAGVRLTTGINDLATLFPIVAKTLLDLDPKELSASSHKRVSWQCTKGHIFISTPADQTRGLGCGVCAGKQISAGVNDLRTTHPSIAIQADGWDATKVTKGSNKKLNWKCKFGHIWVASPNQRTNNDSGCPICSGRKLLPNVNDLMSKFPEIGFEADGWDPSTALAGSNQVRDWKCALGHKWKTQINLRTSQGTNCPVCSGHKLLTGYNDLSSTHPLLAKEAYGWDPSELGPGSHKKMEWECANRHHWSAEIKSRTSGAGCPICANKRVLQGFNDLASTHPEIALEADGWAPTTVVAGSNKIQSWKCREGHKWKTSPNKRVYGLRGCPSCSKTAYDPNIPGWIYLLSNSDFDLHKVGITNNPQNRIALHISRGWELIDTRGPLDGLTAQKWERSILSMLKQQGVTFAKSEIAGKFDGYTESWDRNSLKISTVRELMDMVSDLEGE